MQCALPSNHAAVDLNGSESSLPANSNYLVVPEPNEAKGVTLESEYKSSSHSSKDRPFNAVSKDIGNELKLKLKKTVSLNVFERSNVLTVCLIMNRKLTSENAKYDKFTLWIVDFQTALNTQQSDSEPDQEQPIDVDEEFENNTQNPIHRPTELMSILRYEDSDKDDEETQCNSVVMINSDCEYVESKMKRYWGKQVRTKVTDSKVSGSQHGVRIPPDECIRIANRWFYGDIALINKKSAPFFSNYEDAYFPAVVVGSYKGMLVVIGKCSDDVTILYTGQVMAISLAKVIHPINFCIGVASDYNFFGNPSGALISIGCRAMCLDPDFETCIGDMCLCPGKQGQPLSVLQLVAFVKTNEWKAVFIVFPSSEMAKWPGDTLQCRMGTAGAALFLDKYRNQLNGHVWVPEERLPSDIRTDSDDILKNSNKHIQQMSRSDVEMLKSVGHVVSVIRKLPSECSWSEEDIIAK